MFRPLCKLKPTTAGFQLYGVLQAPGVDELIAAEPVRRPSHRLLG
jgi:hypothetical protein